MLLASAFFTPLPIILKQPPFAELCPFSDQIEGLQGQDRILEANPQIKPIIFNTIFVLMLFSGHLNWLKQG